MKTDGWLATLHQYIDAAGSDERPVLLRTFISTSEEWNIPRRRRRLVALSSYWNLRRLVLDLSS